MTSQYLETITAHGVDKTYLFVKHFNFMFSSLEFQQQPRNKQTVAFGFSGSGRTHPTFSSGCIAEQLCSAAENIEKKTLF